VGRRDVPEPYAFLDNCGNISYYTWLSGKKRRVAGNIITDGYQLIKRRLREVHDKGWELDDETEEEFWWATFADLPIWARLWDGHYLSKEIDDIHPDFFADVLELSELHKGRER